MYTLHGIALWVIWDRVTESHVEHVKESLKELILELSAVI